MKQIILIVWLTAALGLTAEAQTSKQLNGQANGNAKVEQELMQGVRPDLQRFVANLLTLQPGGYFLGALDFHPLALGIPMAYIAGDEDLAMPRPAAESAARIGVTPVVVPGTNEGLLTHPDEVAKAILEA